MDTRALVQFLHSDRLVAAPCGDNPALVSPALASGY